MAVAVISGQDVNLRKAPNVAGEFVESLDRGVQVETLGADGDWTHVRLGSGVQGWVSSQFVRPGTAGAGFSEAAFVARLAQLGYNQHQPGDLRAILTTCAGQPLSYAAYILATAAHETGRTFAATKLENLNYRAQALIDKYSPGRISVADCRRFGRVDPNQAASKEAIANAIYGGSYGQTQLGNTQPGDGFKYRGRGWVQVTGRRNYSRADQALQLGGALIANPDLVCTRPDVCAGLSLQGMLQGWFTTKALKDYLPAAGRATNAQFHQARRIINGLDQAPEIAAIADQLQVALDDSGWT